MRFDCNACHYCRYSTNFLSVKILNNDVFVIRVIIFNTDDNPFLFRLLSVAEPVYIFLHISVECVL